MVRTDRLAFLAVLVMLFPGIVGAGELARGLVDQMSLVASGQLVKVWIKLPSPEDRGILRAAVSAQAATRAGRHRAAVSRLRQGHADAQEALLQELQQLQARGLASNIKPHWLVNIVEAEVSAGELSRLAQLSDIDVIHSVPEIRLIAPESVDRAAPLSKAAGGDGAVTENIAFIRANEAWAAGYTGAGRLVCSFDTGIEGDHPALKDSWKGNDGHYAAAWFYAHDDEDQRPHAVPNCGYPPQDCSPAHGTHVMGLMVGDDPADSAIGVAPGAKWISAAVIDIKGTSIIDAFEWAANPDGDPNTVEDVPDVINHSWGVPGAGCQNIFYDLIDNTEALGIVNIFAAGNEGNIGVPTIRNPANRALDSLDCFAVGAVSLNLGVPVVLPTSSRGPSDCNGKTKPNVCAPGDTIYSSELYGRYGCRTGTSMAAPQVSGLVALMRQKNPNATVSEIKQAILITARDFGYDLPDRHYGWGVIDCMAALNELSADNAEPNVRVYAFDHLSSIHAGDTVAGTIVLENLGAGVSDVSAALADSDPSLTVQSGTAFFGAMSEGAIVRSEDTIKVIVSDTVTEGALLSLELQVSGSGGYANTARIYFLVEPRTERSIVTHDVGRVGFTVSNFGTLGLGPGSFFPSGGVGFTFDGSNNYLYECGLIVGYEPEQVSDGVRNVGFEPDGDFRVLPGGNLVLLEPGPYASQQTYCRFSDERAENPIGLEITQESFANEAPGKDDFIILRYIVRNARPGDLDWLYFGLFLDWDIEYYGSNAGGWDSAGSFAWMAYNYSGVSPRYRGAMLVDGSLFTALTHPGSLIHDTDHLTEVDKYFAVSAGFSGTDQYKNSATDLFQTLSASLDMAPGQIDTIAFAILAGDEFEDISNAAVHAQNAYGLLLGEPGPWLMPPSQTVIEFATVEGSSDPPTESFRVRNSGTGILMWSIEGVDTAWVSVSPTSGAATNTTPSTVHVGVKTDSLRHGEYVDTFTIVANEGGPVDIQVSLHLSAEIPKSFALHQNYPNPFNSSTNISFDLPKPSAYTLTIYNALGQKVHQVNGQATAGTVKVLWDAQGLASGVYLYEVTAVGSSATRKMILLK